MRAQARAMGKLWFKLPSVDKFQKKTLTDSSSSNPFTVHQQAGKGENILSGGTVVSSEFL